VGHTLSLAINLLGAYVHTNRLQYVEFFGKFYNGGGRLFSPFKENTKYVDVKED
jgi:V/A-type H+-transporting ATPase subunit I